MGRLSPSLRVAFVLAIAVLGVSGGVAQAAPSAVTTDANAYVPGRVIVAYEPGTTVREKVDARKDVGVRTTSRVERLATRTEVLELDPGASVPAAIAALKRDPAVLYAEPDYILRGTASSNDPFVLNGSLWGMLGPTTSPANAWGTRAIEAWSAGDLGSGDVYVGIIDTGVQVTHPDLEANMWTNPFEVPGNGVDDDGNGFVDDVHGWDFRNDDNSVYDTVGDDHGTHVAGTVGGVGGNGLDVVGVNWSVTMIPAKFLSEIDGNGFTSDAILAIDYLTDLKTRHGLNIVATNNSWGGGGYSVFLDAAIERAAAAGIVFVAAAGNDAENNDAVASYPANYSCTSLGAVDCIVSVASIASNGALSVFSNYGATTVDLGAPGSGIQSTVPPSTTNAFSGTSMATPHVTGAIALCAAVNPTLGASDLITKVLATVAPTPSLTGKTATDGRLDVKALRDACLPSPLPAAPSGSPTTLTATASGVSAADLQWADGVTGEARIEIERTVDSGSGCGTFSRVRTRIAPATSVIDTDLAAGTTYCYRVRGANAAGSTVYSNTATVSTPPAPTPYACAPTTYEWVDPLGGAVLSLGDDSVVLRTMPFAFPLYGESFTDVGVAANGFLRLGSTWGGTEYTNLSIANRAEPNALIAAAWDDWSPQNGGQVTVRTVGTAPNRSFVVTWQDVPPYNEVGRASFQIVLYETGAIRLQYRDMDVGNGAYDFGRSASAGVEGVRGIAGTQISYNTATLANESAYGCTNGPIVPASPPTISAISPDSGSTAGGTAVTVTGSGFTSATTVTIGGVACTTPTRTSTTSLQCTTGPRAAGNADVVVANADGQTDLLAGVYAYLAPAAPPQQDGGGGFTSPVLEVPAPTGVRWSVEDLWLVAFFRGSDGDRYAISATDGTRTRSGACDDDAGWVTCRVKVLPGSWVGTITAAADAATTLAAKSVKAVRVARVSRPRWTAPTTRRPAVVRFKAAAKTTYVIRAERITGAVKVARGRCKVRKGRAVCSIRLRTTGRWAVTITPKKGASMGKATTKVLRVKSARRR